MKAISTFSEYDSKIFLFFLLGKNCYIEQYPYDTIRLISLSSQEAGKNKYVNSKWGR